MTDNLYQQEPEFALAALREGALLARRIRANNEELHVNMRDSSLVTPADIIGQAQAATRIVGWSLDDGH